MKIKGFTPSSSATKVEMKPESKPEPKLPKVSKLDFSFARTTITFEGGVYVRVFMEDECLRSDPTATTISDAFRGFTGQDMGAVRFDLRRDDGDGYTDVYCELGAIVVGSYEGSSLYMEVAKIPYAALYGSRWQFEDWRRVADGLRKMRDPDPRHSNTYRLVALGDYADAIAGIFQNQVPMTREELIDAARMIGDYKKQIPNAVEELNFLAECAFRHLERAHSACDEKRAVAKTKVAK
jgi:hypothetical protein